MKRSRRASRLACPPGDTVKMLLLSVAASLVPLCIGAGQKHWGDPAYEVELRMLEVSGGSLQPAFTPGHADYEVEVEDQSKQACEVRLALDVAKYFAHEPPKIQVDGKELDYSLEDGVHVRVLLNETWANVDKAIDIEVIDPKTEGGGSLFGHPLHSPRMFSYRVRIYQGPDYTRVVKPLALDVTDDFGERLVGDSKFDPYIHTYLYIIGEGVATAHINMTCPSIPGHTRKLHEGKGVGSDEQYTLDLSTSFVAHARVACTYQDDRYVTREPKKNDYSFTFERHVAEKAILNAQLLMVAKVGYCEQVDPDVAQLEAWKGDASLTDRGFVCRIDGSHAQVVPALTGTSVEAALTRQSSGESYLLHADRISSIPVSRGREIFTMGVRAGDEKAAYPVLFVRAAPCTDLSIPFGKVRRIADMNHAQTHMCLEDTCSPKRDQDVCFVKPANCSSYAGGCPAGKEMRVDAVNIACLEALCTIKDDQERCCSSKSAVTTTGEGMTFRTGDQVLYQGDRAVIYQVEHVDGKIVYDLVVEHSHDMPNAVQASELLEVDPQTYRRGEQVIIKGKEVHVASVSDDSTYKIEFEDGSVAHHVTASSIRKDPQFFFPDMDLVGNDILESRPDEIVYEVRFEDGSRRHSIDPRDIVALHRDAGEFRVHDQVMAEHRRAFVTEVGNSKIHVRFRRPFHHHHRHRHKVSGWFKPSQVVLVEAGFFPGDYVFLAGREGRIQYRCGQAKKCRVIFKDHSQSGLVSATEIIRKHGFFADEEVVVHGRKGIVKDHCVGRAQFCHVTFADDHKKPKAGTYPPSQVRREVGFVEGEPVVAQGRQARISRVCACKTKASTCEAQFHDDGSSTGELKCSSFVKRGGFHVGLTVLVNGKQGTIVGRRPRAKYDVEFLDDKRRQYAQGENSDVHALQISAEQVGSLVKPLEEAGQKSDGSLDVGSQVVASGHATIISEAMSDDAVRVSFKHGPLSLSFALLTAVALVVLLGWVGCRTRSPAPAESSRCMCLKGGDDVQLLPRASTEWIDLETESSRRREPSPG